MKTSTISLIQNAAVACLAVALAVPLQVVAQNPDPFYAWSYSLRSLGAVPNLPLDYGGLVLKAGNTNTLLIAGSAHDLGAKIFQIALFRDANHHIKGFRGSATYYADAGGLPSSGFGGIDGGLVYGPGNVLLYASSDNSIGQIKAGQSSVAKKVDLTPLGVLASPGGLIIVPSGLPGAGRLKILSLGGFMWYDTTLSPDGNGTFNIATVGTGIDLYPVNVGPESAFYVAAGNPLFPQASVLVVDYENSRVVSFQVNANGDPLLNTHHDFLTGVIRAEGAAVDPVTGDFLFGSDSEVWVVGRLGLAAPTVSITSPANGAFFPAPGGFEVWVNAAEPGGSISEVAFYLDGVYIGHDVVGVPYSLSMQNVAPGTHALTAVAWGSGLCSTSSVVNVTVTNVPARVTFVGLGNNTVKNECADLQLAASANLAYGSITNLAYYLNGSTLLGTVAQPPYLLVVSLPVGANNLTAVATDNIGASSTSAPVRVVFTATPTNALAASLLTSGEVRFCFRGLVSSKFASGREYGLLYRDGNWGIYPAYNYRYSITELKQPVIHAILSSGWEYQPVILFARWLTG